MLIVAKSIRSTRPLAEECLEWRFCVFGVAPQLLATSEKICERSTLSAMPHGQSCSSCKRGVAFVFIIIVEPVKMALLGPFWTVPRFPCKNLHSPSWNGTVPASRHMRPEHIAQYVENADVYAYGEAGHV